MKAESTTLIEQKGITYHEEKGSRDRPWIFFLFSVVVLTCLFAGFVFTGSILVWYPFSEPKPKWRLQLSTILTYFCQFALRSLRLHAYEPTNFQTRVVPLLPSGVGGRTYPFPVVPHLPRRFGTSVFYVILITVVIHLWVADPQRVLWPDSPEVRWPPRRFCMLFLLIFSSLSPTPEIYLPSPSKFDSLYTWKGLAMNSVDKNYQD